MLISALIIIQIHYELMKFAFFFKIALIGQKEVNSRDFGLHHLGFT